MRIILMGLQITVLTVLILISIAAGGGLASLSALAAGSGPAALGGALYFITAFVAAVVGFVALVVPGAILAAITLVCAVTAGYRYLRWTRFLGVAANLVPLLILLLPYFLPGDYPYIIMALLVAYPCINIALFFLLPRRPSIKLARRICRVFLPILYLPIPATILYFAIERGTIDTGGQIFMTILFLFYFFPLYYGYKTLNFTKSPDRRLAVRLVILALLVIPNLVLTLILGIPSVVTLFVLLALAELSILYPSTMPPPGSALYWVARTLGRLPDDAENLPPAVVTNPGER